MTPGQARVALLSFLLVTAGVAINALFLQAGTAPAGKAVAERASSRPAADKGAKAREVAPARRGGVLWSSPEEQALRIARFAADPGKIDPAPAGPDDSADTETLRAIQRELKLRGYGPVGADGVIALTTRAAIMAFEHDHGMALSGEASDRLLKRILLGAADPASADSSGVGRVRSGHAEQMIRSVQQWLAGLGYQPGRIDGRPGEETVKAIRDFEMDKGLVPRGRVSAELVARLSEAAAPKPSSR
jgi:peptidoglycan hydrolase-like protein with peptidoglycan-binding domain